jgi:hypothetical protein
VRLEVEARSTDKSLDRDKEPPSSLRSRPDASGDILVSISILHFRFYFNSRVRVTIELNQAEPDKVTMLTYNVNQVLNIMQLNNILE